MTNAFKLTTSLLVTFVLAAIAVASFQALTVRASAPSGLFASVATTSNPTVTTSASLVFASSTSCAARVVTTYANPVMLTFSDNQGKVPTGTFGTLQPASTTMVYDSGQFGCGAVRVYSFATQAITVVETR